jgi:hypothetical protein
MEKERGGSGKHPNQELSNQTNNPLKEQGRSSLGFTAPKPEPLQGGGIKTPERQPLPSVWDKLERDVRLHEKLSSGRITREDYERERIKLNRLSNEISDKRTTRDNLILDLYGEITCEPTGTLPGVAYFRELSLAEFREFRSKVEPMSDDEICEEIRKAEEENDRKSDELFEKKGGGFPPPNSIVSV